MMNGPGEEVGRLSEERDGQFGGASSAEEVLSNRRAHYWQFGGGNCCSGKTKIAL